jgi:hypothetical protein
VIGVDERTRHADPKGNCSWPEVVVLSVYVPSALRVHVPVTWSDPVTVGEEQPAANPNEERSSDPETFRHDPVAVQVPTAPPPQAVTSEQDAATDVPALVLAPLEVWVVPDPPEIEPDADVDADPPLVLPAELFVDVLSTDEQATVATRRMWARPRGFILFAVACANSIRQKGAYFP